MFPGLGGVSPAKMKAMMKQMGINQDEIEAVRVVIEKSDGKIIIENPSVSKITMQGQESWQISGEAREENSEDDLNLVIEKTGKSREECIVALKESGGDIAEAILKLSQ